MKNRYNMTFENVVKAYMYTFVETTINALEKTKNKKRGNNVYPYTP